VEDSKKHQGLRRQLINTLREKGISSEPVLMTMLNTPRHWFMDQGLINFSYEDQAYPIAANQTISQPYTVAFQSQLLELIAGHKVLEIGTGSGYQTAVLCQLGAKVFSIERHKSLFKNAKLFLNQNNYRAQLFFGDGFIGKEVFAPYDRIIVTCGAPFVPNDLKSQLKVGGRMVIPVGEGEVQQMKLIQRLNKDDFKETNFGDFRFVPMLKNINN